MRNYSIAYITIPSQQLIYNYLTQYMYINIYIKYEFL